LLRNPYISSTGKAWLRPSWVAYLDILGFVSEMRRAVEARGQTQHLTKILSALSEAKTDLMEGVELFKGLDIKFPDPYVVKVFTDNIVLGFPIHDDGESEFGRAISMIGMYQYTLLKHGFFVRGGVAFGDLYMDEDLVYGNGLLDAYEAEKDLGAC
jgi:hypothetical protein